MVEKLGSVNKPSRLCTISEPTCFFFAKLAVFYCKVRDSIKSIVIACGRIVDFPAKRSRVNYGQSIGLSLEFNYFWMELSKRRLKRTLVISKFQSIFLSIEKIHFEKLSIALWMKLNKFHANFFPIYVVSSKLFYLYLIVGFFYHLFVKETSIRKLFRLYVICT